MFVVFLRMLHKFVMTLLSVFFSLYNVWVGKWDGVECVWFRICILIFMTNWSWGLSSS